MTARPPGARKRLRDFLESQVGQIVTSEQLREAAGGISEWARRVRELRDEEGMRILSHHDREDLKPNEYVLESLEPREVVARDISDKLRRQILDRDGSTCQICGAAAGEPSGCESGRRCKLQIDHVVPISQGGTNDAENLQAVCVWYNKDKSNLKVPTSRDAISVLSLIRRQPRAVQLEVYNFLRRKFGSD